MANTAKSLNGSKNDNVSMDDLSEQVQILKSDIAALTSTLGDYTRSIGNEAATKAQVKAQEIAASGKETAIEAQQSAEEFIRTQPATALGLAAGFGFLVGMFTARR